MTADISHPGWAWRRSIQQYVDNTNASETDSAYLRRVGLKPSVLELCGDCRDKQVLDIGSADGWLGRELLCRRMVACDIVPFGPSPQTFVLCDATQLPFAPESFDVVVSSLVLMWLADLRAAYRAAYRVARPNGRLIVALVHPYFYRTGRVNTHGNYEIEQNLRWPRTVNELRIAGRTGPFLYYYRRYDEYLTEALAAGWQLEVARDWFIDMGDYRTHVREGAQFIARSGRVPLYTFMRFVRSPSESIPSSVASAE